MWKIAISYARGTGQVGDFSACSYLLFWLKNIDCKSILQKTLNQFGLVASKYERKLRYKSNFQCVSLRRRVCFKMLRHMFLQSAFQFGFLSSKPCIFPWNLAWNSLYTVEKLKFISLPVKFPAARSKFQFCTTARSCVFFFSKSSGRNNAKHAFQYTFKNNTTQYAKQEEEK